MKRFAGFFLCAVVSLVLADTSFADDSGVDNIRGFTQKNADDLEALSRTSGPAHGKALRNLLELLTIGDLDELPAITDVVVEQVKQNQVFLSNADFLKSAARAARTYTQTVEPMGARFFRQVQASRAELMMAASLAREGDAKALARLSGIGERLGESSRLMSQVESTYKGLIDLLTDETFDPRRNDPEIATARFVALATTAREARYRANYRASQIKPPESTPQADFEHNMVALVGLATDQNNTAKDASLLWVMNLIFLPDIDELPSILNFAADRLRDDAADREVVRKLAFEAQALGDAAKGDPEGALPVLNIQKRRFELAEKGAAASRGDAAALAELKALGKLVMSKVFAKRAREFFYLYHNKGDSEYQASRRSTNAGRAAAAMRTGVFTLTDAKREVEMYQRDIAVTIAPGIIGGLDCKRQTEAEKKNWQDRFCRPVAEGRDESGRPIYKLNCNGMAFSPPACVTR